MKISLVAVGKMKTAHWISAQNDYLSRLKHYAPFQLIEVKDRLGQGLSDLAAMEKEGSDILEKVHEAPALIALTPAGKLYNSPAWAGSLRKWMDTYPTLTFVMGGPAGLSPEILKKSRFQLALSPMTFPHEMARVIFLEQLYRAFTILGGEKYHK